MPLFFTCLICFTLIFPAKALALQLHPAPGSLYAHQMAHAFFMFSMGAFSFWLQKNRLIEQKGWRYIQISALLFILWNMDAMAAHTLEAWMSNEALFVSGLSGSSITGRGFLFCLYYLLKMDHLICVPAIIFLFIGLRKLRYEKEGKQG